MSKIDEDYMTIALNLAKKGKYTTSPNPKVGAIIVKNGRIIGKGYHKKAGFPHAEIYALKEAGKDAEGATMYVTLEPCCHFGKTPPCTDAIIKAKIKKVVIAMKDPNPLVAGQGIEILKKAGIEVKVGVLKEKSSELNKFFLKYITTKMPYTILKVALSLDGKIALKNGVSRWISSEASRKKVHQVRNEVDAILIGYNTLMNDNPHLNVRLVKRRNDPFKIILAGKNKIKNAKKLNLFKESANRIIIVQTPGAGNEIFKDEVHEVISMNSRYKLTTLLKELGKREITSLLVEGGSHIFTSFIIENVVDEYLIFIAPILIGSDGISFFNEKSVDTMAKIIRFQKISGKFLNGDTFLELKR